MSVNTEIVRGRRPASVGARPRVLLVTQASGGGVGRHMIDLAEGLAERDVEVVGLYSPRKLDTACRERLAGAELPPMIAFPLRRALHPADAADLWRLVRKARELGPFDLIHGHSSKGGAMARLAGYLLRIPAVYTPNAFVTQDPELRAWQRSFYGRIERFLGQYTAALIAVSPEEVQHARALGIDANRIHMIPNGITPPAFPGKSEARARLGIGPEEVVIGFVGRLTAQKAPDVMLEAFAQALARGPAMRLVMVGDGPLAADVRRRIERLGLGERVLALGDVVATEVMPSFDLFCLSSRYEGMPYVLIEALAAGLPIVTTEIGGAALCVEPEGNGLIVPRDNAAALAQALVELAADESRRRRYAEASRAMRTSTRRIAWSRMCYGSMKPCSPRKSAIVRKHRSPGAMLAPD